MDTVRAWLCLVVVLGACGSSPTPTCRGSGQACADTGDCCAQYACMNGRCSVPMSGCRAANEACATTADCCSGIACSSGRCIAPPTCRNVGGACVATGDCCSTLVCTGGRCSIPSTCRSPGQTCATTSNCCATLVCSGGICKSPMTCRNSGQSCASTSDCCGDLVCYAGKCAVAGMTWQIKNNCFERVWLRFFDQTGNLVWPDNVNAYFIDPGLTGTYNLACTPGHRVCYGGANDAMTGYWGVGLENDKNCPSCCAFCDGKTYAEPFDC